MASTEYFRLNLVSKYKGPVPTSKGADNQSSSKSEDGILRFDQEEGESDCLGECVGEDEEEEDSVWKRVYAVATADRFLHILDRRAIHDVPRRSFNLQVQTHPHPNLT